MSTSTDIIADGLWRNNPGLVQLLGICPLLAVSNTLINGLGLGIATLAVLTCTNVLVSLSRHWIPAQVRLPVFVLIIASLVTTVELAFKANLYELYLSLGIFIPLIVTNCTILARAEAFASKQPPFAALLDGLAHGLGFTLILTTLGAMRELLGRGSLFSGAESLFGEAASRFEINFLSDNEGLLLALLPPGAFLCLAALIAAKNWIALKTARPDVPQPERI
jgi:electron transport complex protein RnfE